MAAENVSAADEREDLLDQVATAQAAAAEHEEDYQRVKDEIDTVWKVHVGVLEKQIDEQGADISRLEDKVDELAARLKDSEAKAEKAETRRP